MEWDVDKALGELRGAARMARAMAGPGGSRGVFVDLAALEALLEEYELAAEVLGHYRDEVKRAYDLLGRLCEKAGKPLTKSDWPILCGSYPLDALMEEVIAFLVNEADDRGYKEGTAPFGPW